MAWQETLKAARFPTDVVLIDFETYHDSEYHLGKDKKSISIVEYVADPRFEMLGMGYQLLSPEVEDEGIVAATFVPGDRVKSVLECMKECFGKALHNCTVVAKNCKFDMLILAEKYGIYPPYTVDVEDLTRVYEARMSHKLSDLSLLFNLPYKGDTGQFKGKHLEDVDMQALETYTLRDVENEMALFKRLLPIITNPEAELWIAAHTLRLYTRPSIHFDFDLAVKLRTDMQEQIDLAIKDIARWVMHTLGWTEQEQEEVWAADCWRQAVMPALSGDIVFTRLLQAALPEGQSIPTKPGKPSKNMVPLTGEGRIPALAKDDDGLRMLLEHEDDTVRMLATARVAVSSWPNHIGRITKMENQARASRGLLRVPLKYYGAHTGRWSGEESINLGNLGGAGRGKAISSLIGQVRHTMKAPPGCVFVMVDSAQVEARNLAWYAGQGDLVAEFRDGGDPYSTLATDLFKCKVWKWGKDDTEEYPGQEKKITVYRGFGKDAILGCGYGMGADKFHKRCLSNDTLRPYFDSGEYDFDTVKMIVDTYRSKYSKIPEFWSNVERAWRIATKYKRTEEVGPLTFWYKDGTTNLRLPSGRILYYHDARVNAHGELAYKAGRVQIALWGGSITENIVQSTCRDFLRDWIIQIERDIGLHVVHHVYDEIIVMASERRAEEVMGTVSRLMQTGPEWAIGMPFGTDEKISPYYTK